MSVAPIVRDVKRGYLLTAGTNRVEINVQNVDKTIVLDAKNGPKQHVSADPEVWAALEQAEGVKAMTAKELEKHTADAAAPRPSVADTPQPQTESATGGES